MKSSHLHTQEKVQLLNRWRSGYNPLRNLTTTTVVSLLEQGERGIYSELQWMYRMIEKRDSTLRGLKALRISRLLNLEWSITTTPDDDLPKGATPAMAEAQALSLRAAYDQIANLKDAIKHLALASFRGYAHLEKHFDKAWNVTHLEPVDPWFFCRDGLYGEWLYNPKADATLNGDPLNSISWITREVEDPINEVALISFLRKNLSQKDWDGFIEVFGIPSIFMVAPQGLTKEQYEEFADVAESIAGDGRGAIPSGGDVKTVGGDVRGNAPFLEHIKYQDQCTVLAGTGGKLAMLTESGSGTLAGSAHMEVFDDIAKGEANEISEIFRAGIDAAVLTRLHPGQPVLARFSLEADDAEDQGDYVANIKTLGDAGYDVDPDEISERTGYSVSRRAAPAADAAPVPAGRVANKEAGAKPSPETSAALRAAEDVHGELLAKARLQLAEAQQAVLLPVAEALGKIILAADRDDIDENAFANLLQDFVDYRLPRLLEQINADPATEEILTNIFSTAFLNGAAEVYS
jgi:phage gp29-like protein